MIDYLSGDELLDGDATTHFVLFVDSDPISFEEVVKDAKWQKAMEAEINSIEKNHTWELNDFPKGHKTIGVKWVFKTKLNEKDEIGKHKAHLKLQIVTLSTTEVEFVVAASCSYQAILLRRMLEVLVHQQQGPTTIF
ncbi:unnamed protein product [Prunus brigantina]